MEPGAAAVVAADKRAMSGKKKRKQPETAATGEDPGGPAVQDSSVDAAGGGESVEKLKTELAALKAENRQLKKEQRREAKAARREATAAARRERKAAAKQQRAQETQAAGAGEAPPPADVSAWEGYGLCPGILATLARLGFSAPTHVQAACLPAAIRDRRDVVGAAQTGARGRAQAVAPPCHRTLAPPALLRHASVRSEAAARPWPWPRGLHASLSWPSHLPTPSAFQAPARPWPLDCPSLSCWPRRAAQEARRRRRPGSGGE